MQGHRACKALLQVAVILVENGFYRPQLFRREMDQQVAVILVENGINTHLLFRREMNNRSR